MRTLLVILAVASGLVAAGFGLTALFMALAAEYGAIAAAAAVSLFLLTLMGAALIAERIIARREQKRQPDSPVSALRMAVENNPVGTLSALAGLSFIVARQPALAARAAKHLATLLI
ncbi:hypothetical protein [Hyphobacterium sp.]|jgi:membrane protein implicated in regulation of membrane protease activity|uniref:hypothetical protein n=1 Tax=Hyphobacterium sp. TaxID=2004662 RepID=UPI003BAC56D9